MNLMTTWINGSIRLGEIRKTSRDFKELPLTFFLFLFEVFPKANNLSTLMNRSDHYNEKV